MLNTLLYELINVSIYLILLLGHPFIYNSELSWKRARVGYGKYDSSDVPMKLDDIREDAMNYNYMERLTLLKIQRDFLRSPYCMSPLWFSTESDNSAPTTHDEVIEAGFTFAKLSTGVRPRVLS